jgi:hypothetical protein
MTTSFARWGQRQNLLELVDAVHPLGLLGRVHKAAKRRPELLPARPVCHTTQARAVPVDLSSLGVVRRLLAAGSSLSRLSLLSRRRLAGASGSTVIALRRRGVVLRLALLLILGRSPLRGLLRLPRRRLPGLPLPGPRLNLPPLLLEDPVDRDLVVLYYRSFGRRGF